MFGGGYASTLGKFDGAGECLVGAGWTFETSDSLWYVRKDNREASLSKKKNGQWAPGMVLAYGAKHCKLSRVFSKDEREKNI